MRYQKGEKMFKTIEEVMDYVDAVDYIVINWFDYELEDELGELGLLALINKNGNIIDYVTDEYRRGKGLGCFGVREYRLTDITTWNKEKRYIQNEEKKYLENM